MKKHKFEIIFLLLIIYISAFVQYSVYTEYRWLYALGQTLIVSFVLMITPIVLRIKNKKPFSYKQGAKICRLNSFILFIISIVLTTYAGIGITGGIGAIIYYFVNMNIISEEKELEKSK